MTDQTIFFTLGFVLRSDVGVGYASRISQRDVGSEIQYSVGVMSSNCKDGSRGEVNNPWKTKKSKLNVQGVSPFSRNRAEFDRMRMPRFQFDRICMFSPYFPILHSTGNMRLCTESGHVLALPSSLIPRLTDRSLATVMCTIERELTNNQNAE